MAALVALRRNRPGFMWARAQRPVFPACRRDARQTNGPSHRTAAWGLPISAEYFVVGGHFGSFGLAGLIASIPQHALLVLALKR